MARVFDPEIGRATRWKKGDPSPNPGGRPSNILLTSAYRAVLGSRFPGDKRNKTFAQVIAERVALEASKGNLRAASELADRVEGKARQALEFVQQHDETAINTLDDLSEYELWARIVDIRLLADKLIDQCESAAGLTVPGITEHDQVPQKAPSSRGADAD